MEKSFSTLSDRLRHQARVRPNQDFLRAPGRNPVTYGAANQSVDQLAAGLQGLGISAGCSVVLLMSNSPEQVLVWMALNRIGARHVPLNSALSAELLARSVALVKPSLIIADVEVTQLARSLLKAEGATAAHLILNGNEELARPNLTLDGLKVDAPCQPAHPDALEAATLLFTSGSTGHPKACVLSHRYLVRAGEIHAHYLGLGPDDVLFTPFPLFHIDAATLTVSAALAVGATAALSPKFSASRFWDEVRSCGATVFNFMGATANILWKQLPSATDKDHSVRLAWGVPMPACEPDWQARFGFPLIEVYGLTDAGLPAYQPLDMPRRAGSCGRVIAEYELCIADETGTPLPPRATGEILIRAREPGLLMNEYFAMPEVTAHAMRGGWFHTGDFGRLDAEGFLYFHTRSAEVIRRRGENIAANDVEAGVNSHPDVRESAAVGVLSELTEDDIKVYVVSQTGAPVEMAALWSHCCQVLPRHMVPRYFEMVQDLPKTPTQKIERHKLREMGLTADTWDSVAAVARAF